MNNFWIPEEINLTQDTKDYPHLTPAERTAYDKILSFLDVIVLCRVTISRHSSEYITASNQPLPAYSSISRVCTQPELQLYARLYL
ncbi:MAG: ribonucleotide-diphosphate reductase subunit beta [Parabacteroides distasonis]